MESARIETATIKTAEISAARQGGTSMEIIGVEITTAEITAERRTTRSVPYMDTKNFGTIGKGVFSTRIAVTSIQTKQKSSLTSKPMGPTRSTERFTMPDRKSTGVGNITDKDADSKVAAGVAAAEGGTKVGADFRAAVVEAEGGNTIKGIASKGIIRATITKAIITKETIIKQATSKATNNSKGITMITITTMDLL